MKECHTAIEFVYCENDSQQTGRKIGIALWSEEEKMGYPAVIMSIGGDEFQIALQDVFNIEYVIQSFTKELYSFLDREYFERNKLVLKKTNQEEIISMFERYHKHMNEMK